MCVCSAIVEDEPYMAEAIRDGLRLEAIAADIAGDGETALRLLSINGYDIAVLDRDIPGRLGDEIARHIVASDSGMPILMLTAADRLDDKASGFGLGADDYLTKPFELRELVLRLRALDRRRAPTTGHQCERSQATTGPVRREVYRDGRHVALTRKQFAVLEVLVAAEGGVISAEELLERAWTKNADPFTNAVRITVLALRKRLGEPWVIATVAGVWLLHRHSTRHRPLGGKRVQRPWTEPPPELTLSYAGFLMLAGALLLAAVGCSSCVTSPTAPSSSTGHAIPWPITYPVQPPAHFRSEGSQGMGVPADVRSSRRVGPRRPDARPTISRITDATRTAANGSLSHRIRLPGRNDEFHELADAFDTMLARLEANVAEQRRFEPTPPTNCVPR